MLRRILLLAGALVLFASGIAIGQTPTDTFTGCLTPGGDLKNVAIGDTPTGECKGNSVEVTWNAEGTPGPPGASGIYSMQIEVREQLPDPTTMQPGEQFEAQTDYFDGDLVFACNPGDQVVNFHGAWWSLARQWDLPDWELSDEYTGTWPSGSNNPFGPVMNEAGDAVVAMTAMSEPAIEWRLSVYGSVSRGDTSASSSETWFTATLTCASM